MTVTWEMYLQIVRQGLIELYRKGIKMTSEPESVGLDELRRLSRMASPTPWKLCEHLKNNDKCSCGYRGGVWSTPADTILFEMGGSPEKDGGKFLPESDRPTQIADAAYIVAAINALPTLLERLETLTVERDNLVSVLDRIEAAVMSPNEEGAPSPQTRDELAEYVARELEAKADFWASFQFVGRENRRLRTALEFYADRGSYDDDGVVGRELRMGSVVGIHNVDFGDVARAALEPHPEPSDV